MSSYSKNVVRCRIHVAGTVRRAHCIDSATLARRPAGDYSPGTMALQANERVRDPRAPDRSLVVWDPRPPSPRPPKLLDRVRGANRVGPPVHPPARQAPSRREGRARGHALPQLPVHPRPQRRSGRSHESRRSSARPMTPGGRAMLGEYPRSGEPTTAPGARRSGHLRVRSRAMILSRPDAAHRVSPQEAQRPPCYAVQGNYELATGRPRESRIIETRRIQWRI
jgi:hypothetical protein